jgi:hypothetical protein
MVPAPGRPAQPWRAPRAPSVTRGSAAACGGHRPRRRAADPLLQRAVAGPGARSVGPETTLPGIPRGDTGQRVTPFDYAPTISRMRRAVSDGVLPTRTPAASRASFLACAVPAEPDTIAPACPMVLPSGAVKPAT